VPGTTPEARTLGDRAAGVPFLCSVRLDARTRDSEAPVSFAYSVWSELIVFIYGVVGIASIERALPEAAGCIRPG
jgi:hypothetical protein